MSCPKLIALMSWMGTNCGLARQVWRQMLRILSLDRSRGMRELLCHRTVALVCWNLLELLIEATIRRFSGRIDVLWGFQELLVRLVLKMGLLLLAMVCVQSNRRLVAWCLPAGSLLFALILALKTRAWKQMTRNSWFTAQAHLQCRSSYWERLSYSYQFAFKSMHSTDSDRQVRLRIARDP